MVLIKLAIVLYMKAFKSVFGVGFLLLILFPNFVLAFSTPVIISFQGQLRENSIPVSGNRTMHFRILDVSSNVIWQSNASLATQVTVTVSNGIYTVGLGDTSLSNMAALTSSDLDQNKKLFLRVRVGIEDLSPDILLSAVPFAYIAKQTETITQNITAGNSVVLALRQATQNVGLFNASPTGIFQVSSNYLFVSSNGNIGVSTANPQEILDINGRIRLNPTTVPGATNGKLYNVGGNLFWNGVTLNTISGGSSQWTTTASSAIYYSSGNVGIGTNAPITDFEIRKDAASALGPILSLTNYPGGGGAAGAIDFHTYVLGPDLPEVRILANDNNYSADLIFYTKTPGAQGNPLVERMRISNNGNLGIGNNSPINLFQVSVNALVVSSNGNVGIATNTPSTSLEVSGSISVLTSSLSLPNGNNNNLAIGSATYLLISRSGGNPTITGISGGAAGRILYINFIGGAGNFSLANQDTNSLAANRIITTTGATQTTATDGGVILVYDGMNSRWRVVSFMP
jgi:hypothetical protein